MDTLDNELGKIKCDASELTLPAGVPHCYLIDDMRVIAQYRIDCDTFLGRWDTVIDEYQYFVLKIMPSVTNPDAGVEAWLRKESADSRKKLLEIYANKTASQTGFTLFKKEACNN